MHTPTTHTATPPRLLIAAGGTGGHILPALAVAKALHAAGWQIDWLGNPDSMEARMIAQHNHQHPDLPITFHRITFSGVRGKGWRRLLRAPFDVLRAVWQVRDIMQRIKPNVVLGMGGYIAFPAGVASKLCNIPLVIHEQNAIAGQTNYLLSRIATQTLVAFPHALVDAPRRQVVGNPVRDEVIHLAPPEQRWADRSENRATEPSTVSPLKLLVIGGSLGAAALNETIPRAIALLPDAQRPHITHQAGAKHLDTLRANYTTAKVEAHCVAFIEDMAHAYSEADVVICRAGAMTVAELACAGVASMLVPFPFAVDDHQTNNARYLSDHGAAWLMPQEGLNPEGLAEWLQLLSRPLLLDMARKARALAQPNATTVIADYIRTFHSQN
jgi:UDP-N-acetylglucosamine--N-acetylmuramyl-(pentapeptide) pyrophosphoryl-undecaprenol N-acetylglucosamine transferase